MSCINELLDDDYSDSMIEDFIESHPEVDRRKVLDIVAEYEAPTTYRGCAYIQNYGVMPCIRCARTVKLKDYYTTR